MTGAPGIAGGLGPGIFRISQVANMGISLNPVIPENVRLFICPGL